MKKFTLLWLIGFLLSSCSSYYYQVYKVSPVNDLSKSNNSLIYEDSNCSVFYDFWGVKGDVGFMIYNKSDKDIYVSLNESFFIKNGVAYDYYKNREFTSFESTSKSSMYTNSASNTYSAIGAIIGSIAVSGYNYQGFRQTNSTSIAIGASKGVSYGYSASASRSNTSGSGVNTKEKDIICIPPKSAKTISEYSITSEMYTDCNLFSYPKKKQIRTSSFSENESPFIFSNRISYTVEGNTEPIKFENKFYVSAITNYPEKEITHRELEELCENKEGSVSRRYVKHIKDSSPDKFYLYYKRKY